MKTLKQKILADTITLQKKFVIVRKTFKPLQEQIKYGKIITNKN